MRLLALLLILPALSGCFWNVVPNALPTDEYYDEATGLFHAILEGDTTSADVAWAPGALSTITSAGPALAELPADVLILESKQFQHNRLGPTLLGIGENLTFLPSPATTEMELYFDGYNFMISAVEDIQSWNQIVSGELAYNLSEVQEAQFPHRTPGTVNYGASIDYFADFFEELGYEVEVDPYNTQGATDVVGCSPVGLGQTCPESVANVVATKPGTNGKTIFVAGGHFDMVPQTTHAAFDDTSGVVTTMALAEALAPYEFEHTLKFGLWGGEENGIIGSQFWVQSNPQAKAEVVSYWNLDVVGMSWPAPIAQPDPHVIAAGPDIPSGNGETIDPVSGSLLNWAQHLQRDVFGFPDEVLQDNETYPVFIYEGVASGQYDGYAGVNAQSDHTPFIAAGIPSYFIFNGNALSMASPNLHTESDTLANMTKYALYGNGFAEDTVLLPSELEEAKDALQRSWEAVMFFPFYHTLLVDLGEYDPPSVA